MYSINCNALSSLVMKCMKKVLLVPAIYYFLVLASEALKRGGKHRRFFNVFLMWSETVSVINLQTLKLYLKVHKNVPFLLLKFKNFLGGARPPSQAPLHLCPLNSLPLANTSGSTTDNFWPSTNIQKHRHSTNVQQKNNTNWNRLNGNITKITKDANYAVVPWAW